MKTLLTFIDWYAMGAFGRRKRQLFIDLLAQFVDCRDLLRVNIITRAGFTEAIFGLH